MWGRNKGILQYFENLFLPHTVDGGNPAPVDRQFIPLITGVLHPRFCSISSINSITHMFIPSCAGNPGNPSRAFGQVAASRAENCSCTVWSTELKFLYLRLRRDGAKIIHQGEHLIYVYIYMCIQNVKVYVHIYIYVYNVYIYMQFCVC